MVQWLRIWLATKEDTGLISGLGTKISDDAGQLSLSVASAEPMHHN